MNASTFPPVFFKLLPFVFCENECVPYVCAGSLGPFGIQVFKLFAKLAGGVCKGRYARVCTTACVHVVPVGVTSQVERMSAKNSSPER